LQDYAARILAPFEWIFCCDRIDSLPYQSVLILNFGIKPEQCQWQRTPDLPSCETHDAASQLPRLQCFQPSGSCGSNATPTSSNFDWVTGDSFPQAVARWLSIQGRLRF
jgi:hypothetical protein